MYYRKEVAEAFEELATGPGGLAPEEARSRLEKYGPNSFKTGKEFDILATIIHQFTDPLIYILIIAAVFTALLGHWIDTYVIMAVVFLNAIIGFSQEYKAEKAISALISMAAPRATVVRGNRTVEVDSQDLVPGDIVLLASGAKVPADLRLFETTRLEINESALTGESLGVRKDNMPLQTDSPALGEARNTAFMGTLVLSGRGKGIVVATGRETQLGRISEEVAALESAPTPLQVQLAKMSRKIGVAILGVSVFAVFLGILLGRSFVHMLLTGIALAVGAIPEGLPIVVTITLAVGVKRMAVRSAIVRRLPAVETLGSTTVIASDKTGTLTKNEMTVQKIFTGYREYQVTGAGFTPTGEIVPKSGNKNEPGQDIALQMCLRAGMLANESSLELNPESGKYKPQGDPTEVSLIVSALKGGLREDLESGHFPKIDEIPFESDRLYMATMHKDIVKDGIIVFVKGAPDRVIGMCNKAMDDQGESVELNHDALLEAYQNMGRDGLRVLAMAYARLPGAHASLEPEMLENDLTFIGLQGMVDPPREEAFAAVKQAKKAGVRVIMVTGDHHITAVAIARQLGIIDNERTPVITGKELEMMSDEELFEQVGKANVFSRVAPLQKLRIVQQLIRRGEVVAVTGDGVNDTPALKAAHIGVAMGRTGTDAAKETSAMVITNDNFASIFEAVKEGRVVFANIRKVTLFLLSTGLGQIILILATLILFLPLPLLPAQILWMNLVTNGLQDISLGFEPGEKGIVDQPPRHPDEPVISRLMIERLLVIGVVLAAGTLATFVWQLNMGADINKARTVALTTMVLYQLFNVFNSRSETQSIFQMNIMSNPFLFYSIIASTMAQLAIIYLPPLQFIFRTTALNLLDWAVILPTALTVVAAVEIDKALRRGRRDLPELAPAEN